VEWAFHAVYPLLGALPGGAVAEEKEKFVLSSGEYCEIDFPKKWKVVSTRAGRRVPDPGQFIGKTLGSSRSTFGIPIAKQGVMN
jgi:hypothetical protein